MSYAIQADLADDGYLRRRVTACAATVGIDSPSEWAQDHTWQLSAQPGWVAAYASAVASEIDRPGADESVITDGMILSAVQAIHDGGQS